MSCALRSNDLQYVRALVQQHVFLWPIIAVEPFLMLAQDSGWETARQIPPRRERTSRESLGEWPEDVEKYSCEETH